MHLVISFCVHRLPFDLMNILPDLHRLEHIVQAMCTKASQHVSIQS